MIQNKKIASILNMGLKVTPVILSGVLAGLMPWSATVAQTRVAQLRNYCRSGESLFMSIETQDFWVNICGGDLPGSYVGVDKSTGNAIRLPLKDYDPRGGYFEAVNGDYTYLVVFNTPKGSFLTVTQGSRELLRQPIVNWE